MFSNLQRKFACCSNSCARTFTRTLVSIGFFLTQVKTVWIAAPSKIIILDGAETLSRTKIFSQFGSGPNRILCTSDQQWRISVPSITRLDRAPNFFQYPCSLLHMFYECKLNITPFLCNHLDSIPVDQCRLRFPACFQVQSHLIPHSYDL